MLYYNTQWHKITYINTKYLTKKEAFFQGFQVLFLTFNCQTPVETYARFTKKGICDIISDANDESEPFEVDLRQGIF